MTAKNNLSNALNYADSGVDIEAGNGLVERIKPLAKATMRKGSMDGLGGFGGLFDVQACGYHDPLLVSATDGVGTKLKLAFDVDKHDTVGIDLVAMCVNDLVVQGAEPLFFLDYFACGSLNVAQAANVISGIAKGCKQAECQLIGGETAEMPGMYKADEYDLAGFSVGAVERSHLLPKENELKDGDVVLGLASNGVHSNGFSLVRNIIKTKNLDLNAPAPFDESRSLGEALLDPTRIYIKSCLPLAKEEKFKALAHITGGGLSENIPRILPDHLGCEINLSAWDKPDVFKWIFSLGMVEQSECLRTFNCGIGMIVVVAAEQAETISAELKTAGETVSTIGTITALSGDEAVTYTGTL